MAEKIPGIIEFGYCDFCKNQKLIKGEVKFKTHVKCTICAEIITETKGTTSSYTRYVVILVADLYALLR